MSKRVTRHTSSNSPSIQLPSILDTNTIIQSQLNKSDSVLNSLSDINKLKLQQLQQYNHTIILNSPTSNHSRHKYTNTIPLSIHGAKYNGWTNNKSLQVLQSDIVCNNECSGQVNKHQDGLFNGSLSSGDIEMNNRINELLHSPATVVPLHNNNSYHPHNDSNSHIKTWGGHISQPPGRHHAEPGSTTSTYYTHIQQLTKQVGKSIDTLAIDLNCHHTQHDPSIEYQHILSNEYTNRSHSLATIYQLLDQLNTSEKTRVYNELITQNDHITSNDVLNNQHLCELESNSNVLNKQAESQAEYVHHSLVTSEVNTLKALNSYYQLLHQLSPQHNNNHNKHNVLHRNSITSQLLSIDSMAQSEHQQRQHELDILVKQVNELHSQVNTQQKLLHTYGLIDDNGDMIDTVTNQSSRTDDNELPIEDECKVNDLHADQHKQVILALQSRLAHELQHKYKLTNDINILQSRLNEVTAQVDTHTNSNNTVLHVKQHKHTQTIDTAHDEFNGLQHQLAQLNQRNTQLTAQLKQIKSTLQQQQLHRPTIDQSHQTDVIDHQIVECTDIVSVSADIPVNTDDSIQQQVKPMSHSTNITSTTQLLLPPHSSTTNKRSTLQINRLGSFSPRSTRLTQQSRNKSAHSSSGRIRPNTRHNPTIPADNTTVHTPVDTSSPVVSTDSLPHKPNYDKISPAINTRSIISVTTLRQSINQLKLEKKQLKNELLKSRHINQQLRDIELNNESLVDTINQLNHTINQLQQQLHSSHSKYNNNNNKRVSAVNVNVTDDHVPSTINGMKLYARDSTKRHTVINNIDSTEPRHSYISQRRNSTVAQLPSGNVTTDDIPQPASISRPHTQGIVLTHSHHFTHELPVTNSHSSASDLLTSDSRPRHTSSTNTTANQIHSNHNTIHHTDNQLITQQLNQPIIDKCSLSGYQIQQGQQEDYQQNDHSIEQSNTVARHSNNNTQPSPTHDTHSNTELHGSDSTRLSLRFTPSTQLNELLLQVGLSIPDHVINELVQLRHDELYQQTNHIQHHNQLLSQQVIELRHELQQMKQIHQKRISGSVPLDTIQSVVSNSSVHESDNNQDDQIQTGNADHVLLSQHAVTDSNIVPSQSAADDIMNNEPHNQWVNDNQQPSVTHMPSYNQLTIDPPSITANKPTSRQTVHQLRNNNHNVQHQVNNVDLNNNKLPAAHELQYPVVATSNTSFSTNKPPPINTVHGMIYPDEMSGAGSVVNVDDHLIDHECNDIQHTLRISNIVPSTYQPLPYQLHNQLPVTLPELHQRQTQLIHEFHSHVNSLDIQQQIELLNHTLTKLDINLPTSQQYSINSYVQQLQHTNIDIPEHLKYLLTVQPVDLQSCVQYNGTNTDQQSLFMQGKWKPDTAIVKNT